MQRVNLNYFYFISFWQKEKQKLNLTQNYQIGRRSGNEMLIQNYENLEIKTYLQKLKPIGCDVKNKQTKIEISELYFNFFSFGEKYVVYRYDGGNGFALPSVELASVFARRKKKGNHSFPPLCFNSII